MKTDTKQQRSIDITTINEVKVVTKPWGSEKWIADGSPSFPYALKEMHIKAPYKTSLQFHKAKQETTYVQKGRGLLHYSELFIDAQKFSSGGYDANEIQKFMSSIKTRPLVPGVVYHVFPGFIHRVEALEDLLLIETSTVELDDIFRLQDDSNRSHGRVESEHGTKSKEV